MDLLLYGLPPRMLRGGAGGAGGDDDVIKSVSVSTFNTDTTNGTVKGYSGDNIVVHLTNGVYTAVWDAAGSAWHYYVGSHKCTPPVDSEFAWINQGTATVSTSNMGVTLVGPAVANFQFRVRKKAAPSTPYTITMGFRPTFVLDNYFHAGLCFRESSSGKLQVFGIDWNSSSHRIAVINWNSPTSYASDQVGGDLLLGKLALSQMVWLRIGDNGTNRTYGWSNDGINFLTAHSHTRTTFCTPDEVGFCVCPSPNFDVAMSVLHWAQA